LKITTGDEGMDRVYGSVEKVRKMAERKAAKALAKSMSLDGEETGEHEFPLPLTACPRSQILLGG
jgi:hypothetical protein